MRRMFSLTCFLFFLMLMSAELQTRPVLAAAREQMIARAEKEGAVVIGGSRASDLRDRLKGFHKKFPFISIKAITSNSADTVNRVVTEAQAHSLSIDLVTIGIPGTELLAQRGLLRAYEFPHLVDFPKGSQPPHGLYVDIVGNPQVQGVYNTEMIPPDQAPRAWEDMLNPKWKGMTMISRSSEEFPVKLAWLWRNESRPDWERSFDFFPS
jgi:iron(III) transport system substrate-binding protein